MSENINEYILGEVAIYTASLSPYLQGVELRQPWQLSAYTNLKIRGNQDFATTLNGKAQRQNFFNETLATENLGTAGTGSLASLDTAGLLGLEINHQVETRDLGQTALFNDGNPFVEADNIEINPVTVIAVNPLNLQVPTSLVQVCSSPSSFDGAIEAFDIRRVADRTSIELPYIARSVKGDNSNTNEKRESIIVDDKTVLGNSETRPFLDSQESFGGIDLPGAFSDADPRLLPFDDKPQIEREYIVSGSSISDTLQIGFVSGGITYTAARVNDIQSDEVYARHGFVFSQNDNYKYDSIAFAGLVKSNRVT